MKKPTRSLFARSTPERLRVPEYEQRMMDAFEQGLGGAWASLDPPEADMAIFRSAAKMCREERAIEGWEKYSTGIELDLERLERALAEGDARQSALWAMAVTKLYFRMCIDLMYAEDVMARKAYVENRDDGQRERAEQALQELGSVKAAANKLGVTDRQIRNLVPREVRDQILRKRKS